jgi:hypothetical protein
MGAGASSFVRPTACLCRKWRGARASADPRSGAGKRCAEQGVDGLLRDKTRKPCPAPLSGRSSDMDLTLAQRRRGLFLRHRASPDPTRSVPFRRPFAERDHTLHRLPQQRLSTVRMDQEHGAGGEFRVIVPKCQPRMPIMSSKNDRRYEANLKTGAMCLPMVHSSQQARMA